MRVAFVHTRARLGVTTGEDLAAQYQSEALSDHSINVQQLSFAHENASFREVSRIFVGGRNHQYLGAINASDADVVHLHKWFPWLGRNDIPLIQKPVVATLHNWRPLCPVGTLFRDGHRCTDCVANKPIPLVVHGCFRQSRLQSLMLAPSRPYPAAQHPFFSHVAAYIAPSRRAASIFQEYGQIDAELIHVVPSFVPEMDVPRASGSGNGYLFVGQLEETKGIRPLISSWPKDLPLTVVGEGSQAPLLKDLSRSKAIAFTGRRTPSEVRRLMAEHAALVFPSSVLETQGLVIGEAASVGCPVVALSGTAASDQVQQYDLGIVVDDVEDIPRALGLLESRRAEFSANGHRYWRMELSRAAWVVKMRRVYEGVA